MAAKITKKIIEEIIYEELSSLDEKSLNKLLNEVGMLSGIGSALSGMAKDVKGKFQQHRSLPVAQKLAAKHVENLLNVTDNFIGVQDNFNADYAKWSKNPFIKKILDGIEFTAAMDQAASSVENVITKLDAVTSGQTSAAGGEEQPQQKGQPEPPKPGVTKVDRPTDVKATPKTQGARKPIIAPSVKSDPTIAPSVKKGMKEALRKIKAILSENKKVRIIKNNGRKK